MKKNILYLFTLLSVFGGSLVATSCSDADSVKDLTLSQVLSATELTATPNADISITVSWRQMFNADSYELIVSQDPTFMDESQVVYHSIIEQAYTKGAYCEVTLPKLDPETTYYARVQCFNSNGVTEDSKYVYAEVTTVAEQIMSPIGKADVTDHSVTFHWTPGEYVKAIELINSEGEVIATYTPSDDDIAVGEYTIDELEAHTTYTVRLVSETDKTRGRRTFTTLLDLSDATVVSEEDDWVSMVQNATAGSVFAFEPGDYSTDQLNVKINSDVVLAAQDITDMPTFHCEFNINNNASLYCYYLKISADEGKFKDQCFNFASTGQTGSLDIEGCEVYGFVKGLVYINTTAVVNEINITGSYIHDIPCNGGDFIDARSGTWTTLNFVDNTVVNCFNARDFIRNDKQPCVNNVENNTFYNCGNAEANYRLFYTRGNGTVNNFNSNIVVGFNNKRGFSDNDVCEINGTNNVYFNCVNLTEKDDTNETYKEKIIFYDESGLVLTSSPFKDADNGDFRLVDPNLRLKQVGASIWYEQDIEE